MPSWTDPGVRMLDALDICKFGKNLGKSRASTSSPTLVSLSSLPTPSSRIVSKDRCVDVMIAVRLQANSYTDNCD